MKGERGALGLEPELWLTGDLEQIRLPDGLVLGVHVDVHPGLPRTRVLPEAVLHVFREVLQSLGPAARRRAIAAWREALRANASIRHARDPSEGERVQGVEGWWRLEVRAGRRGGSLATLSRAAVPVLDPERSEAAATRLALQFYAWVSDDLGASHRDSLRRASLQCLDDLDRALRHDRFD